MPLDLEAIKVRHDEAKSFHHSMPHRHLQLYAQSASDIPALVAEVERLRADLDDATRRMALAVEALEAP